MSPIVEVKENQPHSHSQYYCVAFLFYGDRIVMEMECVNFITFSEQFIFVGKSFSNEGSFPNFAEPRVKKQFPKSDVT